MKYACRGCGEGVAAGESGCRVRDVRCATCAQYDNEIAHIPSEILLNLAYEMEYKRLRKVQAQTGNGGVV